MEETSKKVRHTPGPWAVTETDDDTIEIYHTDVKAGHYHTICVLERIDIFDVPECEIIPNAHLIASAPTLLRALEDIVFHYSQMVESPTVSIMQAEKAIKLAKGEIKTELI